MRRLILGTVAAVALTGCSVNIPAGQFPFVDSVIQWTASICRFLPAVSMVKDLLNINLPAGIETAEDMARQICASLSQTAPEGAVEGSPGDPTVLGVRVRGVYL